MGHRLARDEANSEHLPTWLAEQVLEQGFWPGDDSAAAPISTTRVERMLLANLIHARKQAEVARVQLDAIEGIGHG